MAFQFRHVVIVFVAALLCACGESRITTGPLINESRDVGAFHSIAVEGTTRLEITVGAPASVQVEGRELFLKRLETEVRDGVLHIRSQRRDWVSIGTSPQLSLRIGAPQLTSLKLQGGNQVRLQGFAGGSTSIRIEGAAEVRGTGHLDQLTVFMAGAGHADLSDLVADSVNVTVAGVGSVFVNAAQTLDATMNGLGAILYAGAPHQVNTRVNGLGTIGQRNRQDPSPPPRPPVNPDSLQPEYEEPSNAAGVI